MSVIVLGGTVLLLIGYGIYYWHKNTAQGMKSPLKKALLQLFLTSPFEVLVIVIILLIVLAALIKTMART